VMCVHLENGTPVQLEDRYVNPKMAPTFLEQDFTEITPGEYLLNQVPVDQIEHVVDAVLPTKEQAALLDMTVQEPCLQLTRRTWWHDMSVTWVRCVHPGARYRLGSRFRPAQRACRNSRPGLVHPCPKLRRLPVSRRCGFSLCDPTQ